MDGVRGPASRAAGGGGEGGRSREQDAGKGKGGELGQLVYTGHSPVAQRVGPQGIRVSSGIYFC